MAEEDTTQNKDVAEGMSAEDSGEKLRACEEERDRNLAGWQRAKADFLNYKKEELQRLEDIARYGNEEMIREFITVLDNFDLAIAVTKKTGRAVSSGEGDGEKLTGMDKGVYMIRTQMEDILRKRGLEKINISPGDPFNPAEEEAIAEAESESPPGTIAEIIEPGYRLHGKVIRAARVIIARHKESSTTS